MDDTKAEIEHAIALDHVPGHTLEKKDEVVVVESAFAGLSRTQTIRKFHRCVAYVLLACVCALNDGYEFSYVGRHS